MRRLTVLILHLQLMFPARLNQTRHEYDGIRTNFFLLNFQLLGFSQLSFGC